MDITPVYHHTWREVGIVTLQPGHRRPIQFIWDPCVDIVTLQPGHHRPFQFIWDPYVYSL
jgi:hypothetical protein